MSDLPRLYADHLARDRRRSVHTVRAYEATATRLCGFLAGHWGEVPDRTTLAKVGAADLRAFLALRRGEGLGNASAARELSAVRGFLAFATGEAMIPRLNGPRVKKGVPRPVSPDEAVALAEDVAEDASEAWIGARDLAVLLLLYGAGLRVAEALGLTGAALPLGATLSVTGKRDKTRIVPLLPQVRAAIEAYVALCPYGTPRDAPIFRGAKGGPLSPRLVRRAVQHARCGWGCPTGRRRTRCATRLQPICWGVARICGVCRNCSAMRASARRKSTRTSMPRICSMSTATRIRAPSSAASSGAAATRRKRPPPRPSPPPPDR